MTPKQQRFCDEYLIDLNATQSAIRAGYSEKSATVIANENLTKPYIKEYIQKRMQEKEDSLIASQDEVLKYLTSVIRGQSKSQTIAVVGVGKGFSEAIKIEKNPDEKDKLKAAELLGKRYGIYTDKVEQKLDATIDVTIDYGDAEEKETDTTNKIGF